MKIIRRMMICFFVISMSQPVLAKDEAKEAYEIPDHVISIAKENKFQNQSQDTEEIQSSKQTKEILETTDVTITNPELIKLLNETTIKPSPIGIGYRGMIFLGRFALNYESEQTTVNWEYQEINQNELNNHGGDSDQLISYHQEERKEIIGALTNKITDPDDVRQMMLLAAKDKTKLPLTYQTVIGEKTTLKNNYKVAPDAYGILQAHAPAVHEQGKISFGEVYIELKGTKKSIVVKNVVKQGIGAWIPIKDYVTFSYNIK